MRRNLPHKSKALPKSAGLRIFLIITLFVLGGWQAQAAAASAVTVNLKNFGAIGDNVADDGPALQKALDALASAGGGTLIVPQGRYAIITPVVKDFTGRASSITILGVESSTPVDPTVTGNELSRGLDLVSEFTPKTGSTKTAINIAGLQTLLIKDITFLGTANATTDAKYSLLLDRIEDATIRHCEFYGLASLTGAVLMAQQSRLRLEQIKFLGCGGSSGAYLPVVQNLRWKGITVTDVIFIDYGQRELFSKTVKAMPISWLNIGNAEAVTADSPRREVVIRNSFFDEGSYSGISSLPYIYQPPSAPIDLVYIERIHVNVNNSGGSGSYFDGLRGLLIEKSVYTWSHRASACFETQGVGHAIIDQTQCLEDADTIIARTTTDRLSLVNSVYASLNSLAQVTKVFNTKPEDDPVQYVRQRYNAVLGRGPEPAAHFYWSDLILRCGDDQQCAANVRANLDTYLKAAPPLTFNIAGRVADANGLAFSGILVTLGGSQALQALTDANGRYSFNNLLTSGSYTVTVSKPQYTFVAASRTFNAPTANQTADFTGTVNKYTISGRVLHQINTTAMPGVTITVTGSQSAKTTTDSDGYFSFQLPALGDYTITPTLKSYFFEPTALTFNQLVDNQAAFFGGTPGNIIPVLISHDDSTRAIALDAVLRTDEPFQFTYDYAWGGDKRTRILLYADDFDLPPNDTAASVSADAEDAAGRIYPMTVEYVGEVPELPWLTRVVIRLNDDLKDVGDVLVRIKYRGISSNRVRVGIGHVGGGPPDDPGAVPTPGRP